MAGIFLFFRMLNSLITTKRAAVIMPLVFILFSGADIVGRAITHFQVGLIYHIEWWAGWIEYASNMTSLFWVPQHAIAVWLGAAILLLQAKRPTLLPYLALAFSAICLWSPFAAIGLAPFALVLAWRNGIKEIVFDWRPVVALVLIALPTMLYLTNSAGQIPHGFIGTPANRCVWSESAGAPCFSWPSYFLFVVVEFAVLGIILLFAKRDGRAMLIVALSSLMLIPLYKAGAYNDFGMRVSMAGLAVLAILAGELIVTGPRLAAAAMIVALALGLPTSMGEVARVFTDVPGVDVNSSLEKSLNDHPEVLPQYFARLPISVLRTSKEAPLARAQN
ncbi:hypothetical protein EOS_33095 [Caballeronia mineralivorans PML1(12)]|uniref:Uncharacterized protein n=1 Tax=Caballeronia mineralivorans PML1(12) TaxID=908627 RepID=A0A0J1CN56_9BURK|nr:hypothetical protein [Caballeronia mineralivorans]KLU21979.1 hypothetical protein EOS_33095 [Caballeronia mineralivorans PML1(12)]